MPEDELEALGHDLLVEIARKLLNERSEQPPSGRALAGMSRGLLIELIREIRGQE
jgi:hypothetical protein